MEKEDVLLGVEMGRLEIEPIKLNKIRCNGNPFMNTVSQRNLESITHKESQCPCSAHKKVLNSGVTKKKHNRLLKEPTLKLLKNSGNINALLEVEECYVPLSDKVMDNDKNDPLNLCTLVRNCNQLKISPTTERQTCKSMSMNNNRKWWKHEASDSHQEHKESRQQSSQPGTCSQQALNPPCDVTIDELASYFETLVHIPKKMSSMAEMMYI